MAWQMNFTDSYGDNWPNSYWVIVQCNSVPRYDETGMVMFYGYEDQQRKGKRIIGQKQYQVAKSDYEALVKSEIPVPLPNGIVTTEDLLMYGIYTWSKNKLDTPDGDGGFKSFFDQATKI